MNIEWEVIDILVIIGHLDNLSILLLIPSEIAVVILQRRKIS